MKGLCYSCTSNEQNHCLWLVCELIHEFSNLLFSKKQQRSKAHYYISDRDAESVTCIHEQNSFNCPMLCLIHLLILRKVQSDGFNFVIKNMN